MNRIQGTKRDFRMTRRDNPISPLQNGLINRHHPERSVCEIALQFLPGRQPHSSVDRPFPLFPEKSRPALRKSQLRAPNARLPVDLLGIEKAVRFPDHQLDQNCTVQVHELIPPVTFGPDQGLGRSLGIGDFHATEPFPVDLERPWSLLDSAELHPWFAMQRDRDLLSLCRPPHQFGKAVLGLSKRETQIARLSCIGHEHIVATCGYVVNEVRRRLKFPLHPAAFPGRRLKPPSLNRRFHEIYCLSLHLPLYCVCHW